MFRCLPLLPGFFMLFSSWLNASTLREEHSQTAMTQTQAAGSQAENWGLSQQEWSQYQRLKSAERGIWSPGLDPLTMLGIEATTEAERRRFAELLVKKEYQRVEKELAFQRAYDDAWQRLFPNMTPLAATEKATIQGNNRLALFVKEQCTACTELLERLIKEQRQLDIYLVGSQGDDHRLRRWALAHKLQNPQVKNRTITLNHDNGRWLQLGQGKMPALLEKRGDQWHLVTP